MRTVKDGDSLVVVGVKFDPVSWIPPSGYSGPSHSFPKAGADDPPTIVVAMKPPWILMDHVRRVADWPLGYPEDAVISIRSPDGVLPDGGSIPTSALRSLAVMKKERQRAIDAMMKTYQVYRPF